jgi:hypothetical protein
LADQIADRNAARFDAYLPRLRPAGFQKIADHRAQLVHALQNRFEMILLVRADFSGQTVKQDGNKLMNAGQRGSKFV